jgi:ADP-ribose pyrophosphatase
MENRERVYSGRVFDVMRERVLLPNGNETVLDLLRHPGAAAMVAVTRECKLLLLRQYRHAAGGFIWEIPAGTLEPGEEPLECARRELVEETGFSANAWEKIGEIVPVPGYSDERIHIFLAKDLVAASKNLDKDEVLEVHPVDFKTAMAMAANGEIQDAKTICGLFLAGPRIVG